nr:uncharacterized protein CTRU02_15551 [Colletotrichum truncatum]KAF6780930.1 hypothetical protein CTRU02_15551 [Colletotrichum truncatum]
MTDKEVVLFPPKSISKTLFKSTKCWLRIIHSIQAPDLATFVDRAHSFRGLAWGKESDAYEVVNRAAQPLSIVVTRNFSKPATSDVKQWEFSSDDDWKKLFRPEFPMMYSPLNTEEKPGHHGTGLAIPFGKAQGANREPIVDLFVLKKHPNVKILAETQLYV